MGKWRASLRGITAVIPLLLVLAGCSQLIDRVDKDRHIKDGVDPVYAGDNGSSRPQNTSGAPNYIDNGANAVQSYDGTLRGGSNARTADPMAQSGVFSSSGGVTAGPQGQDVSLNFHNVPLREFIDQVLGGALNVNFIAPPDIQGSVNFETSSPVSREALIPIVRDILAANGLLITQFNGIYYIGTADVIAKIKSIVQAGGGTDTKVVWMPVGDANPNKVREFILPLLPADTQIIASPANGALIVRGNPAELDQIQELVRLVGSSTVGNDNVLIVPLQQSSPEQVATEIGTLYAGRGETNFTLVPLAGRRAIMLSSPDKALLHGLMKLVGQLDLSLKTSFEVRVLTLKNIPAKLAAEQLALVFKSDANSGSGVFMGTNSPATNASKSSTKSSANGGSGAGANNILPTGKFVSSAPRMTMDGEDGTMVAQTTPPKIEITKPASSKNALPGPSAGSSAPSAANNGASEQQQSDTSGATVTAITASGQVLTITPNERNNALLINSDYATYKKIQEIVEALDLPEAQVLIEATVLEVELNDNLQYGVSWFIQQSLRPDASGYMNAGTGSSAPTTSQPATGSAINLSDVWNGNPVKIVVQGLQAVTNVKVISSPYLTVVDGKEATLQIGQEIPFATAKLETQTGTVTQTVETKNTGIILKVMPKINGDDSVNLTITQEVSEAVATDTGTSTLTPTINTRKVTSDVLAYSGGTIALGGLIQNKLSRTSTGVPVVSRIPVVGELFKQSGDQVTKTELLVLITPKVMRNSGEIKLMTQKLRRQLKFK